MALLLGIKRFLTLYIGGGIVSSICHVMFQGWAPGLGASGAVYATIINSIILFPQRTLLIYGIIPLRAWILGSLLIVNDVYELNKSRK